MKSKIKELKGAIAETDRRIALLPFAYEHFIEGKDLYPVRQNLLRLRRRQEKKLQAAVKK